MAYKFPWTNYHELNLDWILDTVKKLFAQTEQNNAVVEQYDGRLTEVELIADNAQQAAEQAQQNSTAALDLAQNAAQTATQAQQAAGQAQQAAGQAQQAAGQAQQTATQEQQTAQNFDGSITQAENNAASALQAAQAFDEQVQGAITAANNANEAATAALTKATETERELAAQRSTLEGIVSDGVDSLQEAAQNATEEIEAAVQSAIDSIPADYTTLSDIVANKKADVIYNTAAGDIASFNDGADDMKIKSLIVNIEPVQAGSGDPSPDNMRPISGRTGVEVMLTGSTISVTFPTEAGAVYGGTLDVVSGILKVDRICHTYKGGTDSVVSSRGYDQNNRCMSIRAGSYPHATTDNDEGSININKPMCDKLPSVTFNSIRSAIQGFASQGNWAPAVALKVQGCSTDEEYDAWCLANEPQISWILATPIEYQLTPQQVKTLYQYNNIWSDAGPVNVEYPADTKTYIDNKFAELQALILEH